MSKEVKAGWLVERPQTPDRWADWWHPKHGWTRDANRALRFARQQDAEDYIKGEHWFTSDVVATEHVFLAKAEARTTEEG